MIAIAIPSARREMEKRSGPKHGEKKKQHEAKKVKNDTPLLNQPLDMSCAM